MTATAIPPLQVMDRRFLAADGTLLEPIYQPLYSTAGYASGALPPEQAFFNYQLGNNVTGAGNAAGFSSTLWHTNMRNANRLSKPKRFTVFGVRVSMPNLKWTGASVPALSDPDFGAAAQDCEILEDQKLYFGSTQCFFKIGEKSYLNHPTFAVPPNFGYGGVASASEDNGTAATIGQTDFQLPHAFGIYWSMLPYPPLIEDQQSFEFLIRSLWAAPPSLNAHRSVQVFLEGKLAKEVQ